MRRRRAVRILLLCPVFLLGMCLCSASKLAPKSRPERLRSYDHTGRDNRRPFSSRRHILGSQEQHHERTAPRIETLKSALKKALGFSGKGHSNARVAKSNHLPNAAVSTSLHEGGGALRQKVRLADQEKCNFEVEGGRVRTVMQVNGTVDDVVHLFLCPKGGLDLRDISFNETSTNEDVLSVGLVSTSDVQRDVVSEGSGCLNMTMSFSFEKLVGKTDYVLSVERKLGESSESLCNVTFSFTVAGFSLFGVETESEAGLTERNSAESITGGVIIHTNPKDSGARKVLYSGVNAAYITTYKAALEKLTLLVQVQFLDGSTGSLISSDSFHDSLLGLSIEQDHGNSTIPSSYDNIACSPVARQRKDQSHPPQIDLAKCGFGFGELVDLKDQSSGPDAAPKIQFGFHIDPYRVGITKILMTWHGFESMHTEYEDELFTNTFNLIVTGDPPPIVKSLDSQGPLLRSGGKTVQAVLANTEGSASRSLLVDEYTFQEVPGSYRALGDGLYAASFISTPGRGTNASWTLQVEYPDGSKKSTNKIQTRENLLSYVNSDIGLFKISPDFGKAGDAISLLGNFDGFQLPSTTSEVALKSGIYFEKAPLSLLASKTTIDSNMSRIEFILPQRGDLGSSYVYDVKVLVDGEMTVSFPFSYKPDASELFMKISAFGSRYNETRGVYVVGYCTPSSYSLSFPQGFPDGKSVKWRVRPAVKTGNHSFLVPGKVDLLERNPRIQSERSFLSLDPSVFGNQTGLFYVSATAKLFNQVMATSVLIEKVGYPVLGVQLFKPPLRGLRVPDAPLRINSFVTIPDVSCYNGTSSRVMYDWTVGNITTRFSSENFTEGSMANESIPARLGREYVISQNKLVYGSTLVTLDVFMVDDPSVSGNAAMEFSISPPDLVPMIGNGEIRTKASVAKSVVITGENSFDPDAEAQGGSGVSGIDIYKWTCEFSEDAGNEVDTAKCGTGLLPDPNASQFKLESGMLVTLRDAVVSQSGGSGKLYVHYTLQVGKDFRLSPVTQQTVEIDSEPFEIAHLSGISVENYEGTPQDWQKLRYYEGLFLIPSGPDTSWRITVIEPAMERNTLFAGSNVINRPSFYDPNSRETSQDFPLGLAPNALSPGTRYTLEISVFSTRGGVDEGLSTVSLKTLERPRLVFPNMPVVSGDTRTMFVASATVNLDEAYAFHYYFYLVDGAGEEFCIDGCSGSPFAHFYIEQAGRYTIRCHLVDTLGKSTLDSAVNNVTLSVVDHFSGSLPQLSRASSKSPLDYEPTSYYNDRLRDLHLSGDHGNLELLVSTISAQMSRAEVLSSSETEFGILDVAVKSMHQVMVNSAPSTRTSQSYVRTASRLASINSVFFATEEIVYSVLSMVDNAVTKVPPAEAFDLEKDLQLFYNRSIRHMLSALKGFTARVRLQQFGSDSGLDGRSLVVDLFRLQEQHMIQSVIKGAECGMKKSLSTAVKGGVDSTATSSAMISARADRDFMLYQRSGGSSNTEARSGEPLRKLYAKHDQADSDLNGHTVFSVAVLCNKEQGTSLRGQSSEFRWCDSVFDPVEGVQAQSLASKSNTRNRIVFSMMETVDYVWLSGLTADSEPSDTPFLVSTNVSRLEADNSLSALENKPECLKINTSVAKLGVSPFRGCLSMKGFSVQSLQMPFVPKVMLKDFQRNSSAVSTSISKDMSSTVEITAESGGIFGAKGSECPTVQTKVTDDLEAPPEKFNNMGAIGAGLGVMGVVGGALAAAAMLAVVA